MTQKSHKALEIPRWTRYRGRKILQYNITRISLPVVNWTVMAREPRPSQDPHLARAPSAVVSSACPPDWTRGGPDTRLVTLFWVFPWGCDFWIRLTSKSVDWVKMIAFLNNSLNRTKRLTLAQTRGNSSCLMGFELGHGLFLPLGSSWNTGSSGSQACWPSHWIRPAGCPKTPACWLTL